MSYRNPNLLADMARTVDHISGGRLVLGLGSGWFEPDYTAFGYEFGTAITRLHAFRDALPVIKDRMAIGNPPPVHGRIPIMIGGGGEKVMLRLVAEHADIWHGFGTPDEIRHKCEVLDAHCASIGRDPSEIERSVMFEAHQLDEVDDALLEAYVAAGITYFFYSGTGPDYALDGLRLLLEWRGRRIDASR
jgi:alkanesulfonate monooxygenase SsuD/methylene tetrahydromethanopterin reductase-like flavin-dependent oxidoreductase (luciferase family)